MLKTVVKLPQKKLLIIHFQALTLFLHQLSHLILITKPHLNKLQVLALSS